MQVDPSKPTLKAPVYEHVKLQYHKLLSNFAFKFNMRRYSTGKSFVLQTLVALLKAKGGKNAVAVAAPTGIAAVGVGGVTVHKFLGAGLCAAGLQHALCLSAGTYLPLRLWNSSEEAEEEAASVCGYTYTVSKQRGE